MARQDMSATSRSAGARSSETRRVPRRRTYSSATRDRHPLPPVPTRTLECKPPRDRGGAPAGGVPSPRDGAGVGASVTSRVYEDSPHISVSERDGTVRIAHYHTIDAR
jgi:hypothetical protein